MEAIELILMSLQRSQRFLAKALDELTQEEAAWRPEAECNSIVFILWHIARVEDFLVNRVVQHEKELYEAEGWQEKLGTPAKETGYQYTAEQLQAWPLPKLEVIRGYADAVWQKTLAFLKSIPPKRLSEVPRPDRSTEPVGATLGHMATEIALHVGQIAYLRGIQCGLEK